MSRNQRIPNKVRLSFLAALIHPVPAEVAIITLGVINPNWRAGLSELYAANAAVLNVIGLIGLGVLLSQIRDLAGYHLSRIRFPRLRTGDRIARLSFNPVSNKFWSTPSVLDASWKRCDKDRKNLVVSVRFRDYVNVDWVAPDFECAEIYAVEGVAADQDNSEVRKRLNGCPNHKCTFHFFYKGDE